MEIMWKMLQQETPQDYVIGTGTSHSVRQFAEMAFNYVGLNYQDYVVQDQRFMRLSEVDRLIADPSKARRELGWSPRVGFKDLVEMMVEADLKHVGNGNP